jgi:hypothetical protein
MRMERTPRPAPGATTRGSAGSSNRAPAPDLVLHHGVSRAPRPRGFLIPRSHAPPMAPGRRDRPDRRPSRRPRPPRVRPPGRPGRPGDRQGRLAPGARERQRHGLTAARAALAKFADCGDPGRGGVRVPRGSPRRRQVIRCGPRRSRRPHCGPRAKPGGPPGRRVGRRSAATVVLYTRLACGGRLAESSPGPARVRVRPEGRSA